MAINDLRTMVMPAGVRLEVLKLVNAIELQESAHGVNVAGQRAEGFVLGLETAGAFKSATIEEFYVCFERVVASRLIELRTSSTE